MNRNPVHLKRSDWASDDRLWRGVLEGKTIGTDVTVLFYSTEEVGVGPKWHVHPYDEIFIVRTGRALFTIGDTKVEATAGEILLGPADMPHKYTNLGPGLLETTDIHVSDKWIQTDLDDPELKSTGRRFLPADGRLAGLVRHVTTFASAYTKRRQY